MPYSVLPTLFSFCYLNLSFIQLTVTLFDCGRETLRSVPNCDSPEILSVSLCPPQGGGGLRWLW